MPAATIDAYLKAVPEPHLSALRNIRAQVSAAVPDAVEVISYGIPGFKWKGKGLISFAAFKEHCSLFPQSGAIMSAPAFSKYASSKGTLRFDPARPISAALVKRIVKARMAEITADEAARKAKRKK